MAAGSFVNGEEWRLRRYLTVHSDKNWRFAHRRIMGRIRYSFAAEQLANNSHFLFRLGTLLAIVDGRSQMVWRRPGGQGVRESLV